MMIFVSNLTAQNNQRAIFVDILTQIVQGKTGHAFLVDQLCENGHCNFVPIVQSLFNCFAKNELQRINQCEIEAPAKISKLSRGLQKLASKSTPKK